MGYNRVILQGNLTKDPERRVTTSGMAVCEFTVAVNGTRKDDAPYFGAVVVFGNTAESCSRYLGKGSQVLVEGKLKNDEWEDRQTGQKRSKTRIIADSVQLSGKGATRARTMFLVQIYAFQQMGRIRIRDLDEKTSLRHRPRQITSRRNRKRMKFHFRNEQLIKY